MRSRFPLWIARLLIVLPLLSLDWPVAQAGTPLPARTAPAVLASPAHTPATRTRPAR